MPTAFSFRLFGYPIFVDWTAVLIVAWFALRSLGGGGSIVVEVLGGVIVLFGSVLVHELGHAFAGRYLHLRPQSITLHGFGGLTRYGRRPNPKEGMISSLAGPMAGFALGFLAYALNLAVGGFLPREVGWILDNLVLFNLFWSAFNLVPMSPLDGGQLLHYGLKTRMGPDQAWHTTRVFSLLLSGMIIAVGILLRMDMIALIAAFIFYQNYRS